MVENYKIYMDNSKGAVKFLEEGGEIQDIDGHF